MRRIAALALLVACAAAQAAEPPAWLAGHWKTSNGKTTTEEVWLAPASGLMVGAGRTVGGKTPFFEFLRIEQRGDALVFVAQPRGGAPVEFIAARVDADAVVFENLAHDFPQRVIYRRDGDALVARTEGVVKGRLEGEDWRYERVRAP